MLLTRSPDRKRTEPRQRSRSGRTRSAVCRCRKLPPSGSCKHCCWLPGVRSMLRHRRGSSARPKMLACMCAMPDTEHGARGCARCAFVRVRMRTQAHCKLHATPAWHMPLPMLPMCAFSECTACCTSRCFPGAHAACCTHYAITGVAGGGTQLESSQDGHTIRRHSHVCEWAAADSRQSAWIRHCPIVVGLEYIASSAESSSRSNAAAVCTAGYGKASPGPAR